AMLLVAGHETTVTAIDKGVLLLLQNPDQRKALHGDPELLSSTVEEILRHFPKAPSETRDAMGLSRWANADIEVDGVTIPAGDLVLLDLEDANQDEHLFENPGSFDVTRE